MGSPVTNSSQIFRCEMGIEKEEAIPLALKSEVSRETEGQMHPTQ